MILKINVLYNCIYKLIIVRINYNVVFEENNSFWNSHYISFTWYIHNPIQRKNVPHFIHFGELVGVSTSKTAIPDKIDLQSSEQLYCMKRKSVKSIRILHAQKRRVLSLNTAYIINFVAYINIFANLLKNLLANLLHLLMKISYVFLYFSLDIKFYDLLTE